MPYYAVNRDLFELPGGELVLYADWDDIRRRAAREIGRRRRRDGHLLLPDGIAATELVLGRAARAARVLRSRHAGDARPPRAAARATAYIGPRGLRDFDLVLSYTGGAALDAAARAAWARAASRRSTATSIPTVHRPVAPADRYRCRPVLSRHLCGRPAGGARGAVRRAGAAAARAAVPDRRRAVPAGFPLDRQHLLRPPPAAARAPGLLRLVAADAERHPAGHGRDGLVPVGPAVRGGGLRRADPVRRLGGARRLLRARPRDPGRAHDRGCGRGARPCPTPSLRRIGRRRPRARAGRAHVRPARARRSRPRSRAPARAVRRAAGRWRPDMWGIIPAAGRGSRIQPLAFSKELLPVGSRLDSGRRAAVRGQRVSGRAHDPRRRDKICFVISPGKSDILEYYGAGYGDAAIAYVVQPRAERAVRRHLPRRAADRGRRAGDRRPARHDLVSRRRRSRDLPDDVLSFLLFPVEQPEFFDAVVLDEAEPRAGDPGEAARTPRSNWIWGAFKMPGRVLARAARALARARLRGRVHRHAGQRLARRGGAAVGVKAGRGLCRRRHAAWLPRGDRACSATPRRGDDGAAGARVALGWPDGRALRRSSRREPGVEPP